MSSASKSPTANKHKETQGTNKQGRMQKKRSRPPHSPGLAQRSEELGDFGIPRMATASSHAGEGLVVGIVAFSQTQHHQAEWKLKTHISAYFCTFVDAARADTRKNESSRCRSALDANTWQRERANESSIKLIFDDDLKKSNQSEQLTKPERKSKAKLDIPLWTLEKSLWLLFIWLAASCSHCDARERLVCPRGFFLLSKRSKSVFVFYALRRKSLRKLSVFGVLVLPLWFHFAVSFHDASKKHSFCVFQIVTSCVLQLYNLIQFGSLSQFMLVLSMF